MGCVVGYLGSWQERRPAAELQDMALRRERRQRGRDPPTAVLLTSTPNLLSPPAADSARRTLRVAVVSDTHGRHGEVQVPPVDIFIHCGDFSNYNARRDVYEDFDRWLATVPARHKLVIGGNHDKLLVGGRGARMLQNATYLENSGLIVEGLRIWGTPNIRWRLWPRYLANAFSTAFPPFDKIPAGLDILISHSPPRGILDCGAGSAALLRRVVQAPPRLHVFGHAHGGAGRMVWDHDERRGGGQTLLANCAYQRDGRVQLFDIEVGADHAA